MAEKNGGVPASHVHRIEYDAIYFDSLIGVAGTTWPKGTAQNPSNSLANVRTLLSTRKLSKIRALVSSSGMNTITLDADMTGKVWESDGEDSSSVIFNPAGFSVSVGTFRNMRVVGVAHAASADTYILEKCNVSLQTNPVQLLAKDCYFPNSSIIYLSGTSYFNRCWYSPYYPSIGTISASRFSVPIDTEANFINWSGSLALYNMAPIGGGSFASRVRVQGKGTIILDASCTGGDLYCPVDMDLIRNDGNAVTVHREAGDTRLVYRGRVSAVPGANQFTIEEFSGKIPAGIMVDANAPWHAYVEFDAGGLSAAPQGQILPLTAASAAAVFATAGFAGGDVAAGDIVQIIHPALAGIMSQAYGTKMIKADTAAILAALGGAIDARFFQSASGPVEEDAIQGFDITIFDIDLGAVLQANIDITTITAVMEKSTGGGAYSSVGITQPTFAKADGRVYASYRFLAAEWAVGDMYRLRVNNISATVDAVIVFCPSMVWSNIVLEAADIDVIAKAIKDKTDYTPPSRVSAIFYTDPDQAADTGAGTTPATAKKWTDSAIGLCTDGASDYIRRLAGTENIDDDDTDPPIVIDKKGITIDGVGGGHPEQAGEVNASIRRRQNAGWGAAAGPAIDIQKPCSIIGLEVVAVAQPAIRFSGNGGGENGAFSHIESCRFVGWGLMTQAVLFDAGAYNILKKCRFEELSTGVLLDSTVGNNPDFNEFVECVFQGVTIGIDTDAGAAPHNTRVVGCTFNRTLSAAMTYAIRTRGLWDSGEIAHNTFGCTRAAAFDQTVAQLRAQGVKVYGNTYTDGTDETLDANITAIFHEQEDTPVNVNASNAGETTILDLSVAGTRYIVRDLILKSADPGANSVTVKLYKLVNDVQTAIVSFPITTATFANYFCLMDMFGVPHLAGDNIKVTVTANAVGPYAVTGQYSHAKTL